MNTLKKICLNFFGQSRSNDRTDRIIKVSKPKVMNPTILITEHEYDVITNHTEFEYYWGMSKPTLGTVFDSVSDAKDEAVKASGKYYIMTVTEHFCVNGVIDPSC